MTNESEPTARLSIIDVVLREMRAYGQGWRCDWSDFDGRTLRNQLDDLADWAEKAGASPVDLERGYTEGTRFRRWRCHEDE